MKDEMFQLASTRVSRRSFLSAALAGAMLPWFGTRAGSAEKTQATDSAGATRKATASGVPAGTEMVKRIRRSDALLEVVVHNPPFNLVVPEMVSRLHDVVVDAEADADLKIVVFKSALPGYFINHFDLAQAAELGHMGHMGHMDIGRRSYCCSSSKVTS